LQDLLEKIKDDFAGLEHKYHDLKREYDS